MASLSQSRMCGTAFASLKKISFGFFSIPAAPEPNPCLRDADQAGKEAPYATTGNNLKLQSLLTLKLKLHLYLKRL